MKLLTFTKREQCLDKLEPFLLSHEAENCIFIGTIFQSKEKELTLGAYFQDSKLELAWILTPDNILILTEGSEKALQLLAEHLKKKNLKIHRIRGPSSTINSLIKLEKLNLTKSMIQNIYELDSAIPPLLNNGRLRKAEHAEIALLIPWIESFIEETKLDYVDPNTLLKALIGQERLYLWEYNKTILSMAACSGRTFNGIRINLVYTPSHYRRNGYAKSCIYALWDRLLNEGYAKCFIFADYENQTTNSIYQKMGGTLKGKYMDCRISPTS